MSRYYSSRYNRHFQENSTGLWGKWFWASTVAGTVLLSSFLGGLRYNERQTQKGQIPLGFSEIKQMQRAHESQGQEMPPLTKFYAKLNDMTMKIFEANNLAHASGEENISKAFAKELQIRMDPYYNFDHDLISQYLEELPQDAREALHELSIMIAASQDASPIAAEFDDTWSYYSHDNYHTEYYQEEVCSGVGEDRNCWMETRSREVYDNTDHYYTYHATHGENANTLLQQFTTDFPAVDVDLQQNFYASTMEIDEVGKENLQAMQDSREHELNGEVLSGDLVGEFAQTWATGSNLAQHHDPAVQHHAELLQIAPEWDQSKNTARSRQYRTYSRFDSGPKEYRVANRAYRSAAEFRNAVPRIIEGIKHVQTQSPALAKQLNDMIKVGLGEVEGNGDQKMQETLDMAREIYTHNFEGGFDIDPASWLSIFLFTTMGAILGAGLGGGSHQISAIIGNKLQQATSPDETPYRRPSSYRRPTPVPEQDDNPPSIVLEADVSILDEKDPAIEEQPAEETPSSEKKPTTMEELERRQREIRERLRRNQEKSRDRLDIDDNDPKAGLG